MREIVQSKTFKRDYKKVATSGRYSVHDFLTVVEMLANDEELPHKYRDHILSGDWANHRECHIKPDWLLIYKKTEENQLILIRTGSHSELFS